MQASLASCSTITVTLYATRKEWDLKSINVDVIFLPKSNEKEEYFIKAVSVEGNLDDKQRQRLLYIADRCSIHRLLAQSVNIESNLT
mgnify:CR=1 FL=1